uniref:SCP2 domain-containing protein n=1 Tax=Rhabditophanes sp. KR3021 TaxID=114890 RepID=A0AC35U3W5_9BILA
MIKNVGRFANKTAIITGASRGIGKEIALKLAADGANIVVAAKTAIAHPKLPGTIYTAAKEIEAAGGQALACVVDVRDESSIDACIKATLDKFGGIDMLINNASAISLTGTLETSMKTYDLMHQVNVRGTYLMSQKCIPHLKKSSNPHILNISPPLLMKSKWFSGHVAYTMTKFGMSMCVLGMHEELKEDRIGVNALWPRSAIWTSAMDMLSSGEGQAGSRKPTIMADCAYAMLGRDSSKFTGNFMMDEDLLREEGIKNFDAYDCVPGSEIILDFFIPDEESHKDARTIQKFVSDHDIDKVISNLGSLITPDICKKINAKYQVKIQKQDKPPLYVLLDLVDGKVEKKKIEKPDVTLTVGDFDFIQIFSGKMDAAKAAMTGVMTFKGDVKKLMALKDIGSVFRSKL